MIRSLKLKCSVCKEVFAANKQIYYQDEFQTRNLQDIKLLCADCYAHWEQSIEVVEARFFEQDYFLYVDIELKNGTSHRGLDCTPLDNVIVTSLDMPEQAKRDLFLLYRTWLDNKCKDKIKECTFREEHMRTTFSCITFAGENFSEVSFRINRRGQIETDAPVPEKILTQVLDAWLICEANGTSHFTQEK